MTQNDVNKLNVMLDQMFPDANASKGAQADVVAKKTFKDYWPAIKGILQIAKATFGLFNPKVRLAVDSAISAIDTWLAGGTPDFV